MKATIAPEVTNTYVAAASQQAKANEQAQVKNTEANQRLVETAQEQAAQRQEQQTADSQENHPSLEMVAQYLQDFVQSFNKSLQFIVDNDSGKDVIRVVDKDSGDLIRQIPSEEVLRVISNLNKATGNFLEYSV